MKRTLVLLLVTVLCLNMLACSEQTPEDTHLEQESIVNKIEAVENSTVLVLFSLNPSFEIYAEDNGIIQSVKAANEDAEKVLSGKDYHGRSVKDCIPKLLDIMYQEGYLKDGSQLSVNTYVYEDSFPSFDYRQEIENILVSYTSANQISVTYSNTLDVIPTQNEPSVIRKYNDDGTMTELHTFPNGDSKQLFYSAEMLLEREIQSFADGSKAEIWYDEQGRLIEEKLSNEKGELTYHDSVAYRADGYTEYQYDVATDSVAAEREYTLDGQIKKATLHLPEKKTEEYYRYTGVKERELSYMTDGSLEECWFDEQGRPTESKHSNEKGELTYHDSTVYRADGYTHYQYDVTTGSVTMERECAPNGREIKTTAYFPDRKHEVYYSTAGKTEREVSYMVDGSWSERIYNETGSVESHYTVAGVNFFEGQFDSDGKFIYSCRYDENTGEKIEEKKYENGVLLSRWHKESYPNPEQEALETYTNGILAQVQILWGDGAIEIITYDSAGYASVGTTTNPDGSYLITKYAIDEYGTYPSSEEYYNSAGVLTEKYIFNSRAEWINHYMPGGPI